jgi:branched-chain amino acid transport system substrate-binding protein
MMTWISANRVRARRAGVAALGVTVLALAACSSSGSSGSSSPSSSSSTPATHGTYNIQALMDLTGPLGPPGVVVAAGAKAYVKMINDAGGVNGKQLVLTITDTQSTDQGNIAALQKAIGTNPMAVINSGDSSFPAILPILKQDSSLPFLTVGAVDNALYPTPVPNIFMTQASATQQATALVNEAKLKLGGSLQGKKIGFLGLSAAYIDQMLSAVQSEASAAGATVDSQRYALGTTSFSAQAEKIASGHPDAVFFVGTSADAVPGIKALVDSGMSNIPVISYSSSSTAADFTTINDPNFYALRTTTQPAAGTAIMNAANSLGFGSQASTNDFGLGWTEVAVVVQGLKVCGASCSTSAQLLAAIDKIGSFTVPDGALFGPVVISSTRHAVLSSGQFYKLANGSVVTDGSPVSLGN